MDATLSPRATLQGPHATVTPMLRTVLVCDLVDSTALVERLGDVRAMALMQRHDQRLRQALSLCHGQLIDKADGVLALFERPIQALDFALRYQRALRDLGAAEGETLRARVGIHVGDVMIWANAPTDVLAGAKPFEVEGLAKPVAARLMGLALPGQILLSGMAQNLAQRAAGELGEGNTKLRWILHGRYRFKGVPAPMLVHEAGEPGLSPLRPPESGAKAWRELPLWRRPPVLALELLAVGLLGFAGLWSTFRAPPAIAFAERDWVVVADLQNRTGEPLFDDALDTALRIGLEQSRHVNLVSELQVDRALQRMQRQGQPVDRQLATELALREGARAVILPTVAEVGGVLRVSLEVIDPASGVTVYSESEDGRGIGSVLLSLDAATAEVRARLGESLTAISADAAPLELATTANLEALKAFTLGVRARDEGRVGDAVAFHEEAVRLDPGFAMAWLRLAFLRYVENDAEGTRRLVGQALAHRDRLTRRELLFLEGAAATLDDPKRATERFQVLAALYPDDYRARYNFAYFAHLDLLDHSSARRMLAGAMVPQNPARANATYLAGAVALAMNQVNDALALFEQAETLGPRPLRHEYAEALIAKRRYAEAEAVLAAQAGSGSATQDILSQWTTVSLPLDRGRWAQAMAALGDLRGQAASRGAPGVQASAELAELALRAYAGDPGLGPDLEAWAGQRIARLDEADDLEARHVLFQLAGAAWIAAHLGADDDARAWLHRFDGHPLATTYPANGAMSRAARAELALQSGDPQGALATLAPDLRDGAGLYFSRAVQLRALVARGRREEAARVAEWLVANRGRALAEPTSLSSWQPANLVEYGLALRAKVALARGSEHAKAAEAEFEQAWPGGTGLAAVQRRDAALGTPARR